MARTKHPLARTGGHQRMMVKTTDAIDICANTIITCRMTLELFSAHLCEHCRDLSGTLFRVSKRVQHFSSCQQACPALPFLSASVSSTSLSVSNTSENCCGFVLPLPILSASEICANKTFELSSNQTPPLPLMNERSRKCNSCSIFASKIDVSRENIVQF